MVAVIHAPAPARPPPVTVVAGEEASGLARIIGQYLEQVLADSPEKRAEAAPLRGRLGLRAREGRVAVTVVFGDDGIRIEEGFCEPDAVVSGPVKTLMHTLSGRAHPAWEVCRGAIVVVPGTHPLFGYRAYHLMRLPGVHAWSGLPRPRRRVVVVVALAAGITLLAWRVRKAPAGS